MVSALDCTSGGDSGRVEPNAAGHPNDVGISGCDFDSLRGILSADLAYTKRNQGKGTGKIGLNPNRILFEDNAQYVRTALVAYNAVFDDLGDLSKKEYLIKIVKDAIR